jgi:uncharacterized membrane protein
MKEPTARALRIFLTGLLAALPLVATVAVFWWLASFVFSWLGPDSAIGQVLVAVGFGVSGSEFIGYLIGMGVVLLGIFGLGLVVTNGLQRGLSRLIENALQRIPLVGSVYDLARRLVGLFAQRKDGGMNSMNAVWCHFGGPPDARDADATGSQGVVVLALLSTPEPVFIDGRPYLGVIVPTAPVPVGGGLLYVPESWVRPAGMGIEAVTSIYVSMGITSGEHLPAAVNASSSPPSGTVAGRS